LNRSTRRTIRLLYLASVVFCALLVGCDQSTLVEKFTPPEDESIARSYVNLLMQRKFEQIENALDPSIVDANAPEALAKMAAMFPAEPLKSMKVVGTNLFRGPDYSESGITLECEFPSKWLLVNVVIRKKGPAVTIAGFHVNEISDSLENLNRFTLRGKNALRYSVLALAVLLSLFSLSVLVLCARTQPLKRKWLWILFILVGVGRLAVNWTTGEWSVTPLALHIPCAHAFASPYGPWTIAVYFPLGAALFLRKRKKTFDRPIQSAISPNASPD
jgi:hypothetical protein